MTSRFRGLFGRVGRVLWWRGLSYPLYVFGGVLLPAIGFRAAAMLAGLSRKIRLVGAVAVGGIVGIGCWMSFGRLAIPAFGLGGLAIAAVIAVVIQRVNWRRRAIGLIEQKLTETTNCGASLDGASRWSAMGPIDADGRIAGVDVAPSGLDLVSESCFVPRKRFGLDIGNSNCGYVIRKDFRGDRGAFLREGAALSTIRRPANTPELVQADFESLRLQKTFVPGQTIRDALHAHGAKILNVETEGDQRLTALRGESKIEAVWERGRRVFGKALPGGFLSRLEKQMDDVHRQGITGFSLTFGNVVIHAETRDPWLIDFDSARVHRSTDSLSFRIDRDRDRALFNRIYGTRLVTEDRAREILRSLPSGYAPVDFGGGLVSPGFWSVDSGTGRWEFLNGRVLQSLIGGKRVLDLGSNNGVMPIMMLRAGARAVLAVEKDRGMVDAARNLHRVIQWRDMESYDFKIVCADMAGMVNPELGRFDVVSAFASLYYLNRKSMELIASNVAEMASLFVVQAKTDTRKEAASDKARKSSVEFLTGLLKNAGFADVEVVNRRGFNRPILLARKG